jgi:hypothetical protein
MTAPLETVMVGAGHRARDAYGGADVVLIAAFIAALRSGQAETLTSARNSMESHLMSFAAEDARLNGTVMAMADYGRQVDLPDASAY